MQQNCQNQGARRRDSEKKKNATTRRTKKATSDEKRNEKLPALTTQTLPFSLPHKKNDPKTTVGQGRERPSRAHARHQDRVPGRGKEELIRIGIGSRERRGGLKETKTKKKTNLDLDLQTLSLSKPLFDSSPQARAGLAGRPSSLMMLPSMVDVLPSG